jgi:hypothetical protein
VAITSAAELPAPAGLRPRARRRRLAVSTTFTREQRIQPLENRPWDIRAARVKAGDAQINGRLDEAAWETTEIIGEFYQRSTRDVVEASERTEVRMLCESWMLARYVALLAEPACQH